MKAILRNYRQSPQKVRLIADLVRGKGVSRALRDLEFLHKKAALPVAKLIKSAVANAKQKENVSEENLFIKEIRVDQGIVFRRFMPRARGSASPIDKKSSHISVVLSEQPQGKRGKKKVEETAKQKNYA